MKKSILFLESGTARAIFPVGYCPGTSLVAGHKSTACPNQFNGENREGPPNEMRKTHWPRPSAFHSTAEGPWNWGDH